MNANRLLVAYVMTLGTDTQLIPPSEQPLGT